MINRRKTRAVRVGSLSIGSNFPITVQSMANTSASDTDACVSQALRLQEAGCDVFRFAVPEASAARVFEKCKNAGVTMPLVADIHFDWKLAVESVNAGVDKVRINPGNIGDEARIKEVARVCNSKNIPIRIGVNSGSLEKNILAKYGGVTADAMLESGLYHISLLEKFDFNNIVLSLKSSDTRRMYDAYVKAAEVCPYPLHLGVTEAGTKNMGTIKSSAGIGGLLLRDIGDTLRISLTDNPVEEVLAAKNLLKALNLRSDGIKFVSCPTCGRTAIDLIKIATAAEERFKNINKNITVAIMGCVVNGPGEASAADIGIAGGNGCGVLFKNGEILYKNIAEDKLLDILEQEILKM